ncbi:MAG: pilin [Candidatus Kerfeldbacteria bacterium]
MIKTRISIIAAVAVALFAPLAARAQILPACWKDGNCTTCDFIALFAGWAEGLLMAIGPLVVLMIIIGGVYWIISAGNPERVQRGQQIMIGAVIGLFFVLGAFLLVNYSIASIVKKPSGDGYVTQNPADNAILFGTDWSTFCESGSTPKGSTLQECGAQDDGKICSITKDNCTNNCVCSGGTCIPSCEANYIGSQTTAASCLTESSLCTEAGGIESPTGSCPDDRPVCCILTIE